MTVSLSTVSLYVRSGCFGAVMAGSLSVMAVPLHANSNAAMANIMAPAKPVSKEMPNTGPARPLTQFAPSDDRNDHRIDYTYLDEALTWMVIPMGPSLRESARRPEPLTGTRLRYGHESRFRMEGNRVAFSFLTDEICTSLTEYRKDLEQVGSTLDLTRIPRNEQLAFWLNLHNVAVIEALANEYPLRQPADRTFGSNEAQLDDAKLVTVRGVELSPRDIRERIVYPNWQDPKVIYGFWRGEIGGPSIQRLAYSGDNVNLLLALSGEEFVNSLRGIEQTGNTMRLSTIYREAAPFYFADDSILRAHLKTYAADDVRKVLSETDSIRYNEYEGDLADLVLGESDPAVQNLYVIADASEGGGLFGFDGNGQGALPIRTRPNLAAQRIMEERGKKLNKAFRRGIRTGQVIVGDADPDAAGVPKEVQ